MTRLTVLTLLVVGLAWLAGCNQAPQGTEVRVQVSLFPSDTPALAPVAYQVGDGDWEIAKLQQAGLYTFLVPPGEERYGVAVRCPMTIFYTYGKTYLYQLTTSDTTELQVTCIGGFSENVYRDFSIKVVKAASDLGSYDQFYLKSLGGGTGGKLGDEKSLPFLARPDQDLLIVGYDSQTTPHEIVRILFDRSFDASTPPSGARTYTLDAGNAPSYSQVSAFQVPANTTFSRFYLQFVPRGSTWGWPPLTLGQGDFRGGRYARVPGATIGDLYLAHAYANKRGNWVIEWRLLTPEGPDVAFTLPTEWFTPHAEEGAIPRFSGLSATGQETLGFYIRVGVGSRLWPIYTVNGLLSTAWLGERTEYTLPDLEGLPGFGGTRPISGDYIGWWVDRLTSNHPLDAFLNAADPIMQTWPPLPRQAGLWLRVAGGGGGYAVP